MSAAPPYYAVFGQDPQGAPVALLDTAERRCTRELCGGCWACLVAQADYSGFDVVAVEPQQCETVGDAVGREVLLRRGRIGGSDAR